MRENIAIKYFCKLGLTEKNPCHGYFGRLRSMIGNERIQDLFSAIKMYQ